MDATRLYEVGNKLGEMYVDGDMLVWLFSPQKSLNDAVPAQLILDGKIDEVDRLLDQILDGETP